MKKTGFTRALSLGLALACVSVVPPGGVSSLYAQTTSGNLVGTVRDSTGAAVVNAPIVITNEATGVVVNTMAGASGEYRVNNLLPGVYDISANAVGFQPTKLNGVVVSLNSTSTANITVSIGTSQTVEVTADSGVVLDTTSQNLSQTFQTQELSTLPVTSTARVF